MKKWAYISILTIVSIVYILSASVVPITLPQGARKLSKELDAISIVEKGGIVLYELETDKNTFLKVNNRELPIKIQALDFLYKI